MLLMIGYVPGMVFGIIILAAAIAGLVICLGIELDAIARERIEQARRRHDPQAKQPEL